MIAKLIKLPKILVRQLEARARRRAKETGERCNVSATVRELLRLGQAHELMLQELAHEKNS